MNLFKLRLTDKLFYELSQDNFENKTKKQTPWYSKINDAESYFAICPSCHNTTQIIGLYQMEPAKIYARHYLRKPLEGLGVLDRVAYEGCPRASKNQSLSKESSRPKDSGFAMQVKSLLIEQFDRVIYLLEKYLETKLSYDLVMDMLGDYVLKEGWRYQGATLDNIPWSFAYMTNSHRVFNRIFKDEAVQAALCHYYPGISFDQYGRLVTHGVWVDAEFSFLYHKRHQNEAHELNENMAFVISDSNQNTLFKKNIEFNHSHWSNLISLEDESNRQMHWVDLARKKLRV